MSGSKNSSNNYMTERSVKSISKEINHIASNISTWSTALKKLIQIKRLLTEDPFIDSTLFDLADSFEDLFYNGITEKVVRRQYKPKQQPKRSVKSVDSNSESSSEASEIEVETESQPNNRQAARPTPEADVDVNEFLREVVAAEHAAQSGAPAVPTNNMSKMQLAALKVLEEERKEAEDMDALIAERRKKMEQEMMKPPPARPIKFLSETDSEDGDDSGDDSEGEILDEVSIHSDTNAPALHPLIMMQQNNNLFKGMDGLDPNAQPEVSIVDRLEAMLDNASDQQPTVAPVPVVFTTPEPPEFDPKYGPLFSLSLTQRNKLFYKWFQTASKNVDDQIQGKNITPRTRDRLIREETSRLQDEYLETH
jgi:hypothetical protein